MQHKTPTSNSIIFLMILIVVFSSFSINFVLAEPTSEQSVETTTDSQVINNYTEPGKTLDLKAEGAIVIDAETGLVIYEKNPDERLYPASITKIMTTLLACEYGKYDEVVTHSDNAINGIGYGSSTMGMQVGEQISLESALYGIMMYSANETSMAVAEHISGSVDKFVEMMNNKAKELGCTGTHFANPHGFHDPNHYTTPRDMSLITKEAVKNEDFAKFWGTVDYTLPKTNLVDYERHLHTKVKMLDKDSDYYYQYAIGAKTGFHDDAMNTLVACAVKDGKKVIAVAMKDPGYVAAYADVQLLCEYAFTQFENKQLYDGAEYTDTVSLYQKYNNVDYGMGEVEVVVNGSYEDTVPKSFNLSDVTATPTLSESTYLPVAKGDVLGKMSIKYKDSEIATLDIVAKTSVDAASDSDMQKKEMMAKFGGYIELVFKYGAYAAVSLVVIILIIIIIRLGVKFSKPKKKKVKKNKKHKNIAKDTDITERQDMQSTQLPVDELAVKTVRKKTNRTDAQRDTRSKRRPGNGRGGVSGDVNVNRKRKTDVGNQPKKVKRKSSDTAVRNAHSNKDIRSKNR